MPPPDCYTSTSSLRRRSSASYMASWPPMAIGDSSRLSPTTYYIHPEWHNVVPPPACFRHSHPNAFSPYHLTDRANFFNQSTPQPTTPAISSTSSYRSGSSGQHVQPTYGDAILGSPSGTSATLTSERPGPGGGSGRVLSKNNLIAPSPAALDRYANVYHPLWLRTLPPAIRTIPLPPRRPFPSEDFPASIYHPRQLQHPSSPFTPISSSLLSLPPVRTPRNPLDPSRSISEAGYYAEHFASLLSMELLAQTEHMQQSLLHMVSMESRPSNNGNNSGVTHRIDIPGVREDRPPLCVGDRLELRGLYPDMKLPSEIELEVEVVGMQKAQGWVYVRAPDLLYFDHSLPKVFSKGQASSRYQVRFNAASGAVCAMQDAAYGFGVALTASPTANGIRPLAQRWLFPEVVDMPSKIGLPPSTSSIKEELRESLNAEQISTVSSILNANHQVPFLISGPPGTGKTRTLVSAVSAILQADPYANVLVCAPSNSAADTVARRLATELRVDELLRLNQGNRTFAEVPQDLLHYCCISDDRFGIPPVDKLLEYKVIVTTCVDASILKHARMTNLEMMQAELTLHRALHPRGVNKQSRPYLSPHWTHLLVDEAGQASEPEILIPMSVVQPLPVSDSFISKDPVIVLCGDVQQLGPIITSENARNAEMDISLLERMFQREVYAAHPLARSNLKGKDYKLLGRLLLDSYDPPFANLVKNYRSVAPILMFPSALFYDDTLQPNAENGSRLLWSGLPNRRRPFAFFGCDADEECLEEGGSWYNDGEITIVLDKVQSMLAEHPEITPDEIAIITPWREQVWRLRVRLRELGLNRVDVGNVENYQGREFRITILSCVRSRQRFLAEDRRANLGLVNERKRFNVAITRAKEMLIIVGNANLLKIDPFWNGLLQIALRNDLYRGPAIHIEDSGALMSSLEESIRNQEELSVEAASLTLSGSVAREVLRDS